MTPLQLEVANQKYYRGTAKAACALQMKIRHPGEAWEMWPVDGVPNNNVEESWDYQQARCMWDADGRNGIDENDMTVVDFVDLGKVDVDPHCFCTVTMPKYADVGWNFDGYPKFFESVQLFRAIFQHQFPSPLKKAILEKNIAIHTQNALISDAPFDPIKPPNQHLQKSNYLEEDAAEIDHIIPRVDSHGCLCGDVTPDNAAVISRALNSSMSNTSPSNDKNRSDMYTAFGVVCDDPTAGTYKSPLTRPPMSIEHPFELMDLDETTLDVALENEEPPKTTPRRPSPQSGGDVGGCSTTHGPAGGMMMLAILAACARRRKRR